MGNLPYTVHRPEAGRRALLAAGEMGVCRLCAWSCGVDRTAGPAGICRASDWPRVFHTGVEWVGEDAVAPTLLLNFSGCNMRCSFCLTGGESQDAAAGEPFDLEAFARVVERARGTVRSVTIEGGEPSVHLPAALQALSAIPPDVEVFWKTNGHAGPDALELLQDLPMTWLVDYKFGNDACAHRLARVPRYLEVLHENLRAAGEGLIIRHLLMPGHLECCFRPTVEWLAREMPGVRFSLMNGFLARWKSAEHPELLRGLRGEEMAEAREFAVAAGLRLEPWVLQLPDGALTETAPGGRSRITIDRQGRVLSDFVSADLSRVLGRLSAELGVCS